MATLENLQATSELEKWSGVKDLRMWEEGGVLYPLVVVC